MKSIAVYGRNAGRNDERQISICFRNEGVADTIVGKLVEASAPLNPRLIVYIHSRGHFLTSPVFLHMHARRRESGSYP